MNEYQIPNIELRKKIVDMVVKGKDGHIPSAFSILEIITTLYDSFLNFNSKKPDDKDRDIFILSKGHGCLALYVNLFKHHFISDKDIDEFCTHNGILGEHPDKTKVPGAEASTGSLGHGLSYATGIAIAKKILGLSSKVIVLVGDGECQEGTVWEAANVAKNRSLGNLCVFVDWNQSAMQLLPFDNMPSKWESFGWQTKVIDGHNMDEILNTLRDIDFQSTTPTAIICKTIKGKGAPLIEGHGKWHHRIPNKEEYQIIMDQLSIYE